MIIIIIIIIIIIVITTLAILLYSSIEILHGLTKPCKSAFLESSVLGLCIDSHVAQVGACVCDAMQLCCS